MKNNFLISFSALLFGYRNGVDFRVYFLSCNFTQFFKKNYCYLSVPRVFGRQRDKIMLSVNRGSLTCFFLIWTPFISFSCLIFLARTFIIMFNKNSEHEHSHFVSVLNRKVLNFSLLSMMLIVGLSYMAFIVLGYVPSIPRLPRPFNHKVMLDFIICFFCT